MEQLVLTNNFFRSFPAEVFELENLRVLMLGQNLLTDIPAGLSNLEELQRLSFTSNDLNSLETYSEFTIPYSYQLGFSYNRLDLNDERTVEILTDNHNMGGVQKQGNIKAKVISATTQAINIEISGDWDTFAELKDYEYTFSNIYIFDNSSSNKNLIKVVENPLVENDNIVFEITDALKEGMNVDWQVLIAVTIPTWPETQLYYYDDVIIEGLQAPVATSTPTPTSTKSANVDNINIHAQNNARKVSLISIIILSILGISIITLIVIIIRKKTK